MQRNFSLVSMTKSDKMRFDKKQYYGKFFFFFLSDINKELEISKWYENLLLPNYATRVWGH